MNKTKMEVVNTSTGEIVSPQFEIIRKTKSSEFIQVYLEDITGLLGIKTMSEYKVLLYLWKNSQYIKEIGKEYGNQINVNMKLKAEIVNNCGITEGTIKNCLTSLCKKNVIFKDDKYKGIYYLNPRYFFKGNTDQIEEALKNCKEFNTIIKYEIE